MQTYICLLRAVNVGGTGKLPMADLRAMAEEAGYAGVRTYIQSGNLLVTTDQTADQVKATLEAQLEAYADKPVGVFVRTVDALQALLAANPFPQAAPNQVMIVFLDSDPPQDLLADAKGHKTEEIVPGARAVYVHYPDGMGRSKLRVPALSQGTARNVNTVTKLVALAEKTA